MGVIPHMKIFKSRLSEVASGDSKPQRFYSYIIVLNFGNFGRETCSGVGNPRASHPCMKPCRLLLCIMFHVCRHVVILIVIDQQSLIIVSTNFNGNCNYCRGLIIIAIVVMTSMSIMTFIFPDFNLFNYHK